MITRRLGVLAMAAALFATGCKKKEEEAAPAASAAVEPPPAPSAAANTEEPTSDDEPDAGAAASPAPSAAPKPKVPSGSHAAFQSLSRCCGALAARAKKKDRNTNKYSAASAVCSGLAQQVKKGKANLSAARTTLRAQLQGVPIPGGC